MQLIFFAALLIVVVSTILVAETTEARRSFSSLSSSSPICKPMFVNEGGYEYEIPLSPSHLLQGKYPTAYQTGDMGSQPYYISMGLCDDSFNVCPSTYISRGAANEYDSCDFNFRSFNNISFDPLNNMVLFKYSGVVLATRSLSATVECRCGAGNLTLTHDTYTATAVTDRSYHFLFKVSSAACCRLPVPSPPDQERKDKSS